MSGMILIMIDDVRVSERGARSLDSSLGLTSLVNHAVRKAAYNVFATVPKKQHITFLQPCRTAAYNVQSVP